MKKLYNTYDEYTPDMDFDKNSDDEVLLMLKKQLQITENKGLKLTVRAASWVSDSCKITVNAIYADKITPYHNHEFLEINYVVDGKIAEYVEGTPYVLNKGDLLVMSPGVRHIAYPIGKKVIAKNFITSLTFANTAAKALEENDPSNYLTRILNKNIYHIFRGVDKYGISDKIIDIYEFECKRKNTSFPMANILNTAESILFTLAECDSNEYAGARVNHKNASTAAEQILNYIYEHYHCVSLEDVAKKFGYSTQQIRRIVKKKSGASYVDYVKRCRIGKTQRMLANTNIPISKIAETVGYESPEYFSRRFKFETGYTPTEYRKLVKAHQKTKWEIDNEN